jgi:hypothetical protein
MSAAPETRTRRLAGAAGVVLTFFAVGFIFGAVRVLMALRSGKAWTNYHGDVLTQSELRTDLLILVVGAVLSSALAWVWLRYWRGRL